MSGLFDDQVDPVQKVLKLILVQNEDSEPLEILLVVLEHNQ